MNAKCQLSSVPRSATNGSTPPIYLKAFGTPSNETDGILTHICTKFLDRSSVITEPNIDAMFERICEDGLYDRDQCRWTDRSHYSDALLFLNCLTERSYAALSTMHASESTLPKRRIWVMHPTESSVKIAEHQVLLLVNHDSQGVLAMDDVHAIAELVSDHHDSDAPHDQSGSQPLPSNASTSLSRYDRPFLFGLSIQKSSTMHLVKYDRYGFMTTPFHIHRHPWAVLGCIVTLATCDSYYLGCHHNIESTSMQPDGVSSKCIKTTCYQKATQMRQSADHHARVRLTRPPVFGSFDGSLFPCNCPFRWKFIVDCGAVPQDHAQFLDELKTLEGVPKIGAYRSMTVDCTITHEKRLFGPRHLIVESVIQTVEHLIGITYFSSRKEFFSAMISCIETHRTAYFSHKLLHNDINPRSICLYVNDPSDENVIPFWNSDGTPPIRQAMLRGWRFAKHMDNPGNQMISLCRLSEYEHFLASEILWHKGCSPRRRHDLESFLWVMLFICINFVGPYSQRRTELPSWVPNWLRPDLLLSYRLDICQERFRVEDWTSTCNACFSDYFNHPPIVKGLAHLASKLSPPGSLQIRANGSKSATFPDNPVTHDDMISVLKNIIAELPEEQPPSEDDVQKARERYRSTQSLVSYRASNIYS
ncbi:hypothetical protein CY34DRAFT_813668 [Suillus luteus UH-Slu-Lm8-n1]|uniref:Unplaced genomic scaffold CY34scaffold_826, whole genome shotgun sequence n=1 Tax=Suillus luteus UH-Slu-Lm8-n1 TaxID=930992 RepID=A0A0D0AGM1_9AGAM|nr:hypothetical protein CY34DRAFT_813668 [Suillus luteus UH-Slu-Lm8-n1]